MQYLRFVVKNYWHIIILFVLILFFTVSNAHFLAHNRTPLISSEHLSNVLTAYRTTPERPGFSTWRHFKFMFPPLVYLFTSFFFKIFGVSIPVALWSIYPFSIILIISFFIVGNHFGGRLGGISAALIGTANCYFINHSRLYVLDVPHAALVGLSFFFLLKSEMFKKPLFSCLFGITFGLAMLCRPTSAFFIVGPLVMLFIYFAFRSVRIFLLSLLFGAGIGVIPYIFIKLIKSSSEVGEMDIVFYLSGFFFLVILLLLLTTLTRNSLMEFFKEKNREIVNSMLIGTRAVLLSLLVFMPYYISELQLYKIYYSICYGVLASLNLPRSSSFRMNVISNLAFLRDFFPLIFLLTLIGLIFILIRRKQVLDFVLLLSMGISGFVLTSFSGLAFPRYIIGEALVLAVLGGYWVGYMGKLKFPIIAFISSYTILLLGFPFYSPSVPPNSDKIILKNSFIRSKSFLSEIPDFLLLEPVYSANPYPDRARLFRLANDIEKKYYNSLQGKYGTFGLYFQHKKDIIDGNLGVFEDIYGPKVKLILSYNHLPLTEPLGFFRENMSMKEYLLKHRNTPVFLIIGYKDRKYSLDSIRWIEKDLNRKTEKISAYALEDKVKVDLYLVYPSGDPIP